MTGGTTDAFFRPSVNSLTPYQPGKPVEDVQRELGLERVVKLASNEGPFGPFAAAREAIDARDGGAEPLPRRRGVPAAPRARRAARCRARARSPSAPAPTGASTCSARRSSTRATRSSAAGRPSRATSSTARSRARTVRTIPLADHRYDLDALLDGRHRSHEARLHLPPEQPDRHDEHVRRARRLLRARAGPRADGRRPGVLRVHRPARLPRRGRAVPEARAPGRRAAHVLEDLRPRRAPRRLRRRPRPRSAPRWRRCGVPFDVDDARAGRCDRQHRRRGGAGPQARGRTPRGSRGSRPSCATPA